MSIIQFARGLLPNFERSRIMEDVAQQLKYLDEVLLPNLRNAGKVYSGKHLDSKEGREFVGSVFYAMPEFRSRGLFNGLAEYFSKIQLSLIEIQKIVPTLFSNPDITKETLTYQKVTVLKYLQASRFVANYTTTALSMILTAERSYLLREDSDAELTKEFTKAERDWLRSNMSRYVETLKGLNHNPRDIITAVNKIPDLSVDESKEKLLNQTVGLNKLDPLRLGFIGTSYNPIYAIRMAFTEWQFENYKRGLEEARILELRILNLKHAMDGKRDAATERAIEYNKSRLDKLTAKLKDYEGQVS